jgi:branched-chain amino acid transport system ATP-binding protein
VHPHPFDLDGAIADGRRGTDAAVRNRLPVAGGEDVRRPRPCRCCDRTFDPVAGREPLVDLERDLEKIYTLFPILGERQRQDATTLSGGEQQMCAIGRGMMARPRLLMIDELSLGLAPRVVERIADVLREINRSGLTILLVEQDVFTAFELADHGCVLETGRISLAGATSTLADDPRIRQAYLGM